MIFRPPLADLIPDNFAPYFASPKLNFQFENPKMNFKKPEINSASCFATAGLPASPPLPEPLRGDAAGGQ
jgi:hypothetical protein